MDVYYSDLMWKTSMPQRRADGGAPLLTGISVYIKSRIRRFYRPCSLFSAIRLTCSGVRSKSFIVDARGGGVIVRSILDRCNNKLLYFVVRACDDS